MLTYYLGWLVIFFFIFVITHLLSKHTRAIIMALIKISIALTITLWLALLVFIHENLDWATLNLHMNNVVKNVQEMRAQGLNAAL
jgi:hypothetical protein